MSTKSNYRIVAHRPLQGSFSVDGDKSISHRALILGALASGVTRVSGFLRGADTLAVRDALRALGVSIEDSDDTLIIEGGGLHGVKPANGVLDMGNSGTGLRLMAGVLAAQPFDSVLTGDASLKKRPMRRITEPLSQMGANILATPEGTPPLHIQGGSRLAGIHYRLPVPSAQVKSCLLLAGLYAQGETCIIDFASTRDHTERMLSDFGYSVRREGNEIRIAGGGCLQGRNVQVPGDLSSAAFFIGAAAVTPGADITIHNVGVNPTRDGVIEALRLMGAEIELLQPREEGGEPVADIRVRGRTLQGIRIGGDLVARAIDEIPVLAMVAAHAEGTTEITDAAELRVKESDRILSTASALKSAGIQVTVYEDGLQVVGGEMQAARVDSYGDHRIAMAFSVAAWVSGKPMEIMDCVNVATSFPRFFRILEDLGCDLAHFG